MNETQTPWTVRVAFDGSPLATRAAAWARRLGVAGEADVELVRVMPPNAPDAKLEKESQTADLLVLGTHGHLGVLAGLLGSTSRAVALEAVCPVALVNDTCATDMHRCVVLWEANEDEPDIAVLAWAVDFARRMRLPLHVITPRQPKAKDRRSTREADSEDLAAGRLEVAFSYLRQHARGVTWTGTVIGGSPAEVVARHTYDHDVVAIPRDGARDVPSVVSNAQGLVVVVPSRLSSVGRREPIEV